MNDIHFVFVRHHVPLITVLDLLNVCVREKLYFVFDSFETGTSVSTKPEHLNVRADK